MRRCAVWCDAARCDAVRCSDVWRGGGRKGGRGRCRAMWRGSDSGSGRAFVLDLSAVVILYVLEWPCTCDHGSWRVVIL